MQFGVTPIPENPSGEGPELAHTAPRKQLVITLGGYLEFKSCGVDKEDPEYKVLICPGDILLAEDLEGNPVSTQVDMPFGATSVQVVIDPVPDTIHEYPESLVLTLQPDPAYGLATNYTDAIRINDAKVKAETETLFVGLHVPEGSANTVGFGVATLILNGNNTIGRVNNSFSALTSRQTNTHIHKSQLAPDQLTLLSGPPVEEILTSRSEERRVGNERRSRWSPAH